jgi:hypothetical protein
MQRGRISKVSRAGRRIHCQIALGLAESPTSATKSAPVNFWDELLSPFSAFSLGTIELKVWGAPNEDCYAFWILLCGGAYLRGCWLDCVVCMAAETWQETNHHFNA